MAKKVQAAFRSNDNEDSQDATGVQPIMLISGKWREFLTEYEYKVIIARALNYCVFEHGLVIMGYVISEEKIYLVIKIDKRYIKRMLLIFFEIVQRLLLKHFAAMGKNGVPFLPFSDVFEMEETQNILFEDYGFTNDLLIGLLIGKKRELPYLGDEFIKIRNWLSGCDFCSMNDYAGAVGPIVLKELMSTRV